MKIKTSELTGPALDWAVAIALGYKDQIAVTDYGSDEEPFFAYPVRNKQDEVIHARGDRFKPSTDWSQGGSIKTAARIGTLPNKDGNGWEAGTAWEFFESESFAYHRSNGETELIAVCRCFVASKLGDEVDVPEELL